MAAAFGLYALIRLVQAPWLGLVSFFTGGARVPLAATALYVMLNQGLAMVQLGALILLVVGVARLLGPAGDA